MVLPRSTLKSLMEIAYFGNTDGIKPIGWLVQYQQFRIMQDCVGYAKALFHTKRIFAE